MTNRKIEQSYGRCFGQLQVFADQSSVNNFTPIPSKFSFHMKKNDLQSRKEALANPNGPKEARAWPLILPSKPSIAFWNSLWRDRQMTSRDSTLDSNLNSAAAVQPDQRLVKVLSPLKSQQRQCGVSILFKSITDAKSEPREVRFLMLMPQSGAECEALAERY